MTSQAPSKELLEVKAFLHGGDLVALPVGNLAAVFRVVHDETEGETDFQWIGIAEITGAFHTVRLVKP
jgi:hypothetical protein